MHRRKHGTAVELLHAFAVLVVDVLGRHAGGQVGHVSHHGADLQAHAVLVGVDPVGDFITEVTLDGGHPFGTGGFFQAEVLVETTRADHHWLEAYVREGRFVEVAIIGIAGVVGKVVVDLVFPVLVHRAAQFEVGTSEVRGVSRVAILGVKAIKRAVIGLQTTTQLEAEILVGGCNLKAALGFDNDIGTVSSDSTGESLGGDGQGQGAGRETGEVLADHRRIPLIDGLVHW